MSYRPILALDLGTNTGWAFQLPNSQLSGTWRLDKVNKSFPDVEFGGDIRMARLYNRLVDFLDRPEFDGGVIYYENVQFSLYTLQTQMWASFRTIMQCAGMFCECNDIRGVPVGTLKKFGAGHGAATKVMMAKAYQKTHPELIFDRKNRLVTADGRIIDDNEVDALHLLNYAIAHACNPGPTESRKRSVD